MSRRRASGAVANTMRAQLEGRSRMVRRIGAQPRIERKELEWSKDERQNSD